ncbi:hypothetical protein ACFYTC_46600 [Actinomadura nitritigenes]|uniref:hypothetical protein n=1 Tax=Actinomadura nitritigenes TaxID=134602 RepID=UPI0036C85C49
MTLPVSDWLRVDAVLDNEASCDADDDRLAEMALRIRETGWAQLPDWPTEPAGFAAWPHPGETVTVTLTPPQWTLTLTALNRWAYVADCTASRDSYLDARRLQTIATKISQQLHAPGADQQAREEDRCRK